MQLAFEKKEWEKLLKTFSPLNCCLLPSTKAVNVNNSKWIRTTTTTCNNENDRTTATQNIFHLKFELPTWFTMSCISASDGFWPSCRITLLTYSPDIRHPSPKSRVGSIQNHSEDIENYDHFSMCELGFFTFVIIWEHLSTKGILSPDCWRRIRPYCKT